MNLPDAVSQVVERSVVHDEVSRRATFDGGVALRDKRLTGRGLVDAIILTPRNGELRIELKAILAAMLGAATNAKWSP